MTRRLVLVMVATVAATLLLVGGTTLVVATLQSRATTEADLRELAASVNEGLLGSGQSPYVLPPCPGHGLPARAAPGRHRADGA